MKKTSDSHDIISERELIDHLRSLGFSEDECRQDINEALNLGLFSLVVGRGGVPCYGVAIPIEIVKVIERTGLRHPIEIPLYTFLLMGLGE